MGVLVWRALRRMAAAAAAFSGIMIAALVPKDASRTKPSGDGGHLAGLVARGKKIHRRVDAAFLVRDAREAEPHLDAAERSHQHEVVEVAEMADAKNLLRQLAEPGAERHVEFFEDHLAQ